MKRKMIDCTRCVLLLVALIGAGITPVVAQNYYVSPNGSDANDGLTTAKPFKTIAKSAQKVTAGGTVFIMDGTYTSTNGALLNVVTSGTSGNPITFRAYTGHHPKLTASGNVWNAVSVNGNYVVIDGLELIGNNANITYEMAYQSYQDYLAGNRDWAKIANFNTNAITVGGPGTESKFPHHVTIRNCKVHDFPGGGLNAIQADYVTFDNNSVYNNAWYMMYAGSGISILCPVNSDGATGYKNIVRNNICYSNKTTIPWVSGQKLSDGNGIIIDINKYPYNQPDVKDKPYNGRTLVENNVSYNNGGSGIHAYYAAHVDIVNNTAYHNGTVMGYAEIFSNAGTDVVITNNIMYARDEGKVNSNNKNENVLYDYNLYFNGTITVQGPHDLVGDPNVTTLALDGSADFRLKAGSPAIDKGSKTSGQYSARDIIGAFRDSKPDMGAYELNGIITSSARKDVDTQSVTLTPNPGNDWVALGGVDLPATVRIYDESGKKTLADKRIIDEQPMNVSGLKSGLYIFNISDRSGVLQTVKFVKE